jgi:hypothetical protein
MMMKRAMATVLLLVSACSEPAENVPAIENAKTGDPRPISQPSGAALGELPAIFHGRWGLLPADCEAGRSDNKGLITVEPKALVFYESRGVPATVTQTSPTAVSMDVAFTGEGQEWRKTVRLEARDAVLVREEDDPRLSLTYRRCPA